MSRRVASRRTRPTVTKLHETPGLRGKRTNARDRRAGAPSTAGDLVDLRAQVDRLKEEMEAAKTAVAKYIIRETEITCAAGAMLEAWNAMPAGRHAPWAIEYWLTTRMGPAMARVRAALGG